MADWMEEQMYYLDEQDSIEDYLSLTDDELKEFTARARLPKIMSIRKVTYPLTEKQRYCLAAYLYERD